MMGEVAAWHENADSGVFYLKDGKGAAVDEESGLFAEMYGPLRRFAAIVTDPSGRDSDGGRRAAAANVDGLGKLDRLLD
jgi:hypothetical protein